jgi:hypothetical protein
MEPLPESATRSVEVFVDAGLSVSQFEYDPSDKGLTPVREVTTTGPHLGVGARRAVSERSDFGVRLEMEEIDGAAAIGVRAIDYRYRFRGNMAVGAFFGALRYDGPTPAYGYYGGVNLQMRNVLPRLDLNLDIRSTDKVARDTVLPSDPGPVQPTDPPVGNGWGDVIYQIRSANLYLSYKFK